jgi:phosphohistidine phosphatase
MKTLFLLRHAKSSWHDATLPDFERPLNGRGREAAELVGHFLVQEKIEPDLLVSSPALRARETVEIVMRTAALKGAVRFDERIYDATVGQLMEVIEQLEPEATTVLMVGHNPGFEGLITALTGRSESMSTAALAKITLNDPCDASEGGTLESLVHPAKRPTE